MQSPPPPSTECVHVDITVVPTAPPPKPPTGPSIPPKLLAVMMKYKHNWRLDQLALSIPRKQRKKFVPRVEGLIKPSVKKPLRLNEELKYYADQVSRPKLRNLYINKRLYGNATKGLIKKFNTNIDKAWDSIYNYYKKKERERNLRQLRQKQQDKKELPPIDLSVYEHLAKPKPEFKPEPIKKTSKIFSDFARLDDLASPKPYHLDPPKSLQVSPQALSYEPTEHILELTKLPARYLNQPEPLQPGKVSRGALKYVATERILQMAQPKKISDQSKDDEDFDRWAISKNALKYKPTPRILELSKPIERS